MVPEAALERTEGGLVPAGEGWFVLNATEARWREGPFGAYTTFEGEPPFAGLGINVTLLAPGQSLGMYHGEDQQEDFLVLAGEALLLIEGQQRSLERWDLVHCPPWTEHIIIGAGERGCTLLAVGARPVEGVLYPSSQLARSHGAGVESETRDADEAYKGFPEERHVAYRPGWL